MLPDSCCIWVFLPCSFLDLMAMLNRVKYLVNLPQDRDLKKYFQAAAETPFVPGKFPIFSAQYGLPIFSFVVVAVEIKCVSLPLFELTSFKTHSPPP